MKNSHPELELHPLEEHHISLIDCWLRKEHAKQWFQDPEEWINEIIKRDSEFSFLKHFIVYSDNKPIGFCQFYLCADADEEEFRMFPKEGTYSIDYLIGEEDYLGKGFGKEMILKLCSIVFNKDDSKMIVVKPDNDNFLSRTVLTSAGFSFDKAHNVYLLLKNAHFKNINQS
ncbi:MAG: GNAT family N-acetyltransferase [Fibrobacteres bacterium]|nr:GNAT family N-acetyltransferase [Fibrobacterota bacterium]